MNTLRLMEAVKFHVLNITAYRHVPSDGHL